MIESDVLKSGWARQCDEIVHAYAGVVHWQDDGRGIHYFNKLVPLCSSTFTIGCAGRGSAPERVNAASVLAGICNFVLDDKLTAGAKSARLLPHTSITIAAIVILCAARKIVESRLSIPGLAATDSLFCSVVSTDSTEAATSKFEFAWQPLVAGNLSQIAKDYYNEDLNFQRNLWVTELDESHASRWLVRVMTGHGSHLLSAFSPGMNVAPMEAAEELRVVLESRYLVVLGRCDKLLTLAGTITMPATPVFPMDLAPSWNTECTSQHESADPLAPLDRQCLIDWRLTDRVRSDIAMATTDLTIDAQILLSYLCHSGVSDAKLALNATLTNSPLRDVGDTTGVCWNRFYYSHDFWLPLQRPTLGLLRQRGAICVSTQDTLVTQTAQYLRAVPGFANWPADDNECIARFASACERWRRIELPPSISTMASVSMHPSCLSPLSLFRLANPEEVGLGEIGHLVQKYKSTNVILERNHGLQSITTTLNDWANTSQPKGGQLARAQGLKDALAALGTHRSAVFNFGVFYVVSECNEIISRLTTKSKISTLATRWSALHPTLNSLETDCDPADFEDENLLLFVNKVNEYCVAKMASNADQYVEGSGELRSQRARDALQRLFHVLTREGWEISHTVWESIGGATVCNPRISASSTLILACDISAIAAAASTVFEQEPDLAQRLQCKLWTMAKIPQRIGEASSAPALCVTQTGAHVICKTPFTVDKSDRSSRVASLSPEVSVQLEELIANTLNINQRAEWLYRFDEQACADDQRVNHAISDLIRSTTQDPHARTHALRANAYMELLWPGWQKFSKKYLGGEKNAFDCLAWLRSSPLNSRWTLPIQAAAAAGQGAVDPGYRHYASAWPIVYAAYLQGTLSKCQPGLKLAVQFGIKQNTLIKAKSRNVTENFDRWIHLVKNKPLPFSAPLYTLEKKAIEGSPENTHAGIETPAPLPLGIREMKYVCLRACKWSAAEAGHELRVHGYIRRALELHLLSERKVEVARERKKSTQLGTALRSDVDAILSDTQVAGWIIGLDEVAYQNLGAAMFRNAEEVTGRLQNIQSSSFWTSFLATIPAHLCIQARFGRGDHLTLENDAALRKLESSFVLGDRHRDLGSMPEVLLCEPGKLNYVTARRLTSLLKLLLLARGAIQDCAQTLKENFCISRQPQDPRQPIQSL